jgi:hypothetical protein
MKLRLSQTKVDEMNQVFYTLESNEIGNRIGKPDGKCVLELNGKNYMKWVLKVILVCEFCGYQLNERQIQRTSLRKAINPWDLQ